MNDRTLLGWFRRPLTAGAALLLAVGLATGITAPAASAATPHVVDTIPVGDNPFSVAAANGHVYVANAADGTVSVIDAATNTVTDTIPVGNKPYGVATANGNVYVPNSSADTVSVIDQATNTVTDTITVGNKPYGVATANGHVYIPNYGDGTVSVIDQATNTVTATVTVGKSPRGVAAANGRVYVTNSYSYTVSVIDQATNTVTDTITVVNSPYGVAAANGHAYVTNNSDDTVSVIDGATNTVTDTITVGNNPWGVAAANGHVYVANNGDTTLSVIDGATNTVTETIPAGNRPLAVAAANGRVYITNFIRGTVSVIETRGAPGAPTVSNLPTAAGTDQPGFTATITTSSDGAASVTTATPGVCTVAGDGLTVQYQSVGTCTLVAHVAESSTYLAADGTAQSFTIGQPVVCPPAPFNDVSPSSLFCGDIAWFKAQHITTGFPDGGFHPTEPVTRQTMAAFLYRMQNPGSTAPACTTAPFNDVSPTSLFCGDIAWFKAQHITTGFPDGGFHPTEPVTRQTMAAFLYRMEQPGTVSPACTTAPFNDVPPASLFCGDIAWFKAQHITTGFPDGGFHSAEPVTRQTMAAFLHRLDAAGSTSVP